MMLAKRMCLLGIGSALLAGCMTLSGYYKLTAYNANGDVVMGDRKNIAEGSGIYTVRNALCGIPSVAFVVIRDNKTGEELKGESPYQCR
ncbi:hypothetical protein [Pseudomonas nitroreducens]|uniref:hypothetical protein n=1 Tax=Pseudomonas nitroreducens TaxID=46680 RepID=UPI002D7E61F2|nr:hypothetical protein [Pseudomonas nitroreducens]